jgi:hypothetical protein
MLFQELFSTAIDDSHYRYAINYCSQDSSHNYHHLWCSDSTYMICEACGNVVIWLTSMKPLCYYLLFGICKYEALHFRTIQQHYMLNKIFIITNPKAYR